MSECTLDEVIADWPKAKAEVLYITSELARARAENERLREALVDIRDMAIDHDDGHIRDAAMAALSEGNEP
jgi:hypothetical protein